MRVGDRERLDRLLRERDAVRGRGRDADGLGSGGRPVPTRRHDRHPLHDYQPVVRRHRHQPLSVRRPAVALVVTFVANGLAGAGFFARLPERQRALDLSDAGLGIHAAGVGVGRTDREPVRRACGDALREPAGRRRRGRGAGRDGLDARRGSEPPAPVRGAGDVRRVRRGHGHRDERQRCRIRARCRSIGAAPVACDVEPRRARWPRASPPSRSRPASRSRCSLPLSARRWRWQRCSWHRDS